MVYYIPMRGRGIEEMAAVRATQGSCNGCLTAGSETKKPNQQRRPAVVSAPHHRTAGSPPPLTLLRTSDTGLLDGFMCVHASPVLRSSDSISAGHSTRSVLFVSPARRASQVNPAKGC